MNRPSRTVLALAVLAMPLLLGCPRKKPEPVAPPPPESMPAPPPAPREVTVAPAPDTTRDQRPDPLSADLEAVNEHVARTGLIGDVYFDFDKYDLKPEALERLAKNADFMRAHPEFVFTLEGHCDERGTNEYNLALGDRRAAAARNYVSSLGVANARLRMVSYGEERPVCPGHDESCWWRNRRAHFVVTGRGH